MVFIFLAYFTLYDGWGTSFNKPCSSSEFTVYRVE